MSERYLRQIPLLGPEGQQKLEEATVFIAGAGGLGSPAALYLAAAGVGNIRIVDADVIDRTNLNRQILHTDERVGVAKVVSAKKTLEQLNPEITVTALEAFIDADSAADLVRDADIIVDAMDNFSARYALNEVAIAKDIPLMHAGISGFSGQATLVVPGKTPCLSCIFPNAGNAPEKPPVLGVTAGILGAIEAQETIKYLTGTGETLAGKLLIWDGLLNRMDIFAVKRSPRCPVCRGKY